MDWPESLESWLSRLVASPTERIDLGLDRVAVVHERLGRPRPAPIVITVGGTNGKGSTVAFLVAMLQAAGYRVGSFTSPHLFRFNERIVICGSEAEDASIVAAFRRVAASSPDLALTFFEFSTLAAILLFAEADLDVAVLEVGMGGRLDAVNLIDADAAIVTTVDLDHQQFLGQTRDAIAIEKAGIFRPGRPAVIGDADPPPSLLAEVARIGAHPLRLGCEYRIDVRELDWHWIGNGINLRLPHPNLRAAVQHRNAAAAIAALMVLRDRLHVPFRAVRIGLREASLRGRLEVIPGRVETVLDVGHNPQAARVLADWLLSHPRRTRAVFSALADKDVVGIVEPLLPHVAHWHFCGIEHPARGQSAATVRARVGKLIGEDRCSVHPEPIAAFQAAQAAAIEGERVLVFGSFFLVAALEPMLRVSTMPAN